MSKKYSNLLSPINIGGTVIRNRMVYPNASPHFLQGPETFPADGYIAFVAGLAKNGAGIVTVAEWDNYPDQRKGPADADPTHMQAFELTDPSVHNYISAMADEVHLYGSKLIVSIGIPWPEGYTLSGRPAMGPPRGPIKPLPKSMIGGVIDNVVETLRFYKNQGFDGFTMRVDPFLQPTAGVRNDEYEGSVENRVRFILELYAKVKEELGSGFIAEAQVAGEQPFGYSGGIEDGYTLADTVEFAKLAEGVIDILQIREKDVCKSHPTGFTCDKGEHDSVGYCEAIKAAGANILLEPIGGFQDPDDMERYLSEGRCDMFGMARGFMADFRYEEKLAEGCGEDITPCILCNKCHGTIKSPPDPWVSVCSVNPEMGYQHKLKRLFREDGTKKKLAVIGGGPAGMRAAITAAELGHTVTLFEKTGYLGGQLYHAESFSFKWPIREFRNWLVRQLDKSGVEVRLNTEAKPEDISKEGYDAVIAATGAAADKPKGIKGAENCPTCSDVFGKESELGHNVIIIGGSETGIETAMYLAENGHEVTVLTRQSEIGHNCSKLHYITMAYVKQEPDGGSRLAAAWEKYDNLHGIVNAVTESVEGGKVTYRDAEGQGHTVSADSVVICGGVRPLTEEALAFAASADTFYMAGDCNGAGNLQSCNREGWSRAHLI